MATRAGAVTKASAKAVRKSVVRESSGNVFADLGFEEEEAEHLRIRSALVATLRKIMAERGLTQVAAAELLEVSQPRVSDLVRGKISAFSIDALVDMLARLGIRVDVRMTALTR